MIHIPETIRIKIGLWLILILSIATLAESAQQALKIKSLVRANRWLSFVLASDQMKHPFAKHL